MSATSTLALAAVAAIGVAVLAVAIKAKMSSGGTGAGAPVAFRARLFLTQNEAEFLARLEGAVPEFRFHAQVSMGALIEPAVHRKDGKDFYRARGMFSQKIVDFVAQRRSDGAVIAVIELDDRTHSSAKDAKRDDMLTSAGYRTVRWNSRMKPDTATIRAQLTVLNPTSPTPALRSVQP